MGQDIGHTATCYCFSFGPKWPSLIVLMLDHFSVFFPSRIKGVYLARAYSAAGTYPGVKPLLAAAGSRPLTAERRVFRISRFP
jgi:hypothetical protein